MNKLRAIFDAYNSGEIGAGALAPAIEEALAHYEGATFPPQIDAEELATRMAEADYGPRDGAAFGMGWHYHSAAYRIWARNALKALTPNNRRDGR